MFREDESDWHSSELWQMFWERDDIEIIINSNFSVNQQNFWVVVTKNYNN